MFINRLIDYLKRLIDYNRFGFIDIINLINFAEWSIMPITSIYVVV